MTSINVGKTVGINGDSDKTHKANVQYVKITYPVNELTKCLPDYKAYAHSAKYCAHLKHLEDLHWSFNKNILPVISDYNTRSPSSTTDIDKLLVIYLI